MTTEIEFNVGDLIEKYGDEIKALTRRAIVAELETAALQRELASLKENTE